MKPAEQKYLISSVAWITIANLLTFFSFDVQMRFSFKWKSTLETEAEMKPGRAVSMKYDITIIHIKSDWEHRQPSHELIKILFPNFSQIYTTHLHFTQAGISLISHYLSLWRLSVLVKNYRTEKKEILTCLSLSTPIHLFYVIHLVFPSFRWRNYIWQLCKR